MPPPADVVEPDATPLAVADTAATLDELRSEGRQAAEEARAANTERAYAADWRGFSAFCARIGREHLPAEPETASVCPARPRPTSATPQFAPRRM